ncbi:hypothetical protein JOC58_001177 [Paenibacillus hunanensis]|uniref:Uncharacterized protein n=1 Tax=Paenibacillus hunanensis TaxID=539262 RepID=A0ABU1IX73_9BACL|nr:hypothetical protein [Paenibacillus hunanensis]
MEKTNAWVFVLVTYVVAVALFLGMWKVSDLLFFR